FETSNSPRLRRALAKRACAEARSRRAFWSRRANSRSPRGSPSWSGPNASASPPSTRANWSTVVGAVFYRRAALSPDGRRLAAIAHAFVDGTDELDGEATLHVFDLET